jgi:hypothetical protein
MKWSSLISISGWGRRSAEGAANPGVWSTTTVDRNELG